MALAGSAPAGFASAGFASAAAEVGDDDALRAAAQDLLAGELGSFAASHGGRIDLADVRDSVVTVRLGGACHGCPAARVTLRQRLEDRLRRRCPGLRGVVDAGESAPGVFAILKRPGLGGG